jgi:hypothetical protein
MQELVAVYRTVDRRRRRILLADDEDGRQLLDAAPGDVRVVQRFDRGEGLLQIASVASEYLKRARADGCPLVARKGDDG